MRVVLFVFAGRTANMKVQLPLIRRILAEHPAAELHVWNLARNDDDAAYVNTISGERITVRAEHPQNLCRGRADTPLDAVIDVYTRYAAPEYADTVFVKLDDDVVFLETERFGAFIDAINIHLGAVVSANVINNEACCAATQPAIWGKFAALGVPLSDFHNSADIARSSHDYFCDHHTEMLGQPIELIPTRTWLSVHAIGYTAATARRIAERLNTPASHHPPVVAGRPWETSDEAVLNLFPRIIMRGFTAAHLSFGGQDHAGKQLFGALGWADQLKSWRYRYAEIGQRYLQSANDMGSRQLPALSPSSYVAWTLK